MFAYLDAAATTRVSEAAAAAALRVMREGYGNPSARYPMAASAVKQLSADRAMIAKALGCSPKELFFTSCGTESDNWAVRMGCEKNRRKGRHIITTAIEHAAVLETCRDLERQGWEVTYLQPNAEGGIDLEELRGALRPETALVSIMLVNNELGSVLPIREACRMVKAYDRRILFHTDAVQGFLKVPFTAAQLGADLISISGHKVHAPKGIGALYIRSGCGIRAMMTGGGQENGLRSGTEPTAQIAAFAAAVQEGYKTLRQDIAHMTALKEKTLNLLAENVSEVRPICTGAAPHILALTLPGYKAEVLVRVLGDMGVCVSAGSACHRGKPSHVYAALSLDKAARDGVFRVSFDRETTEEEVAYFVACLKQAKERLFPTMS